MPDPDPLAYPPYTYVPGGCWPHPVASPRGHSHGRTHPRPRPIDPDAWRSSREYLEGIALFNAGYYWEAHEVWERLWHAHERRGPISDLLKALIKLAAAGVKVREGRVRGVATHAWRAACLLELVRGEVGAWFLGLDLGQLAETARAIAAAPPEDREPRDAAVARVPGFQLSTL